MSTPSNGRAPSKPRASGSPKLVFSGDSHSDFKPVIRTVLRDRPKAIVLLGDIQAQRPLQIELAPIAELTKVWWIPGNHDVDTEGFYDNLWGSALAHRNLHGRVARVAGVMIAGLGGVFREGIWDPAVPMSDARYQSPDQLRRHMKPDERWRGGISLRHRSSIFPSDFARLSQQRAQILVTHEGLGGLPHGQPLLDQLARSMRAELVVHGHLHHDFNYRAEGRLSDDSPFAAYGVDKGSHLAWPEDVSPSQRAP